MTTNDLIGIALFILLAVSMYKIITNFYAWVGYKWGQKIKCQVAFLISLLYIISVFVRGHRTVGFVILGTLCVLYISIWVFDFILRIQRRKELINNYVSVAVELHRLKKIGWDKSMKAEQLYQAENVLWDALDEQAHTLIKNALPKIVEEWDKLDKDTQIQLSS